MYISDTTCFDECFLFHVTISRHYFSQKNCRCCDVFSIGHGVAFFEARVLKEVCTVDIVPIITLKYYYQSSKINLFYFTSYISLTNFIFIHVFYLSHFVTAQFSLSMKFIYKTKNLTESIFLIIMF